ncbi:MAG: pyrroline-5-carboxylate reductase [Alphaproteobacteria bacterium]
MSSSASGVLSSFASVPLLMVGCGKMGRALLRGWLNCGLARDAVAVIQPSRSVLEEFGDILVVSHRSELPLDFTPKVVVLATRPQQLTMVTPSLADISGYSLISILAGTSVSQLSAALPAASSVVRAMPNLAVEVFCGVTTLFAETGAAGETSSVGSVSLLFSALGEVVRLEDEEHLELATALSGSGPAYVFLLARALEDGGVELGLSREVSRLLARGMISGSGELLRHREESAAALVEEVAVRGGITDAALSSGLGTSLPKDILEALRAGLLRARALRGD